MVDAILGPGCALAGSATGERRADARLPWDWPRGAVTQSRPHFPRPKVAHPRGSVRRGGAGGEMTRKGGVGSAPHSPSILLRLWASLPSFLDASPVPFLAPLPKCRGQSTQEGAGKGKNSRARGNRRAVAKRSTPGARVEGRESERVEAECRGAEAAEPGADSASPAAAVSRRGRGRGTRLDSAERAHAGPALSSEQRRRWRRRAPRRPPGPH